jgi:hypothetical protein
VLAVSLPENRGGHREGVQEEVLLGSLYSLPLMCGLLVMSWRGFACWLGVDERVKEIRRVAPNLGKIWISASLCF